MAPSEWLLPAFVDPPPLVVQTSRGFQDADEVAGVGTADKAVESGKAAETLLEGEGLSGRPCKTVVTKDQTANRKLTAGLGLEGFTSDPIPVETCGFELLQHDGSVLPPDVGAQLSAGDAGSERGDRPLLEENTRREDSSPSGLFRVRHTGVGQPGICGHGASGFDKRGFVS